MRTTLMVILLSLMVMSCNRKPAPAGQESAGATAEVKGKYELKSAIVEYKSDMMGFAASQTLYFDDHGQLEATVTSMEIMGNQTQTVTVTKEGQTWNFDPDKKTGFKAPAMAGPNQLNFSQISDEVTKAWNLREHGKESFLDKECIRYSVDNKEYNVKGDYWIYKGIPLKMELEMATSRMVMEAVSLTENAEIPVGRFEIPADIEFN
ncbi:MAG TPA: hypothetical protein PLX49_08420 [Prolixibacteraceae bacterium]|nr:hypothetical protein [Prolixibacteraceae bacterium]